MPLTIAHPVADPPLVGRAPLPMAALVFGALVPDMALFVRLDDTYDLTHSLGGLLGVDVLLGTALFAFWAFVARDAWVDLAPDAIRNRMPASVTYTRRDWWLTPLAVGVGAATHLLWDSFTRPQGWGAQHVPWLQASYGGQLGTTWLQLGSGVVGIVVLVVVVRRWLVRVPARRWTLRRVLPRWSATLAGTLIALSGLDTVIMFSSVHPQDVLYQAVLNFAATTYVVVVLGALCWHLRRTCRPRTRTSGALS